MGVTLSSQGASTMYVATFCLYAAKEGQYTDTGFYIFVF
jgi:hypothetical protein